LSGPKGLVLAKEAAAVAAGLAEVIQGIVRHQKEECVIDRLTVAVELVLHVVALIEETEMIV